MKINMFVVSLLSLVKTLAITYSLFLFLILVFNDHLGSLNHGDEVFLYIFLGLFFHGLATIAFIFAILLPMYYIDRNKYQELDTTALYSRHAPIITIIILLFGFFAALIAGWEGLANGLVQANFFTAFVTTYIGLYFFEQQTRNGLEKLNRQNKPTVTI